MADETVSQGSDASYAAKEARRLKCMEHEHAALALGDHERSLRNTLAQLVCLGSTVRQSEDGELLPERALLRFAATTTKAIGIALVHEPMCEDEHHTELDYGEASIALIGLSALLETGPRLINHFIDSGLEIRSRGETRPVQATDEEGAS